MFRIPCRHFILCKVASKTKHFILADILVLVSEFLVVVISSEWWSGPTTADRCGHIPVSLIHLFLHIYYCMHMFCSCNIALTSTCV